MVYKTFAKLYATIYLKNFFFKNHSKLFTERSGVLHQIRSHKNYLCLIPADLTSGVSLLLFSGFGGFLAAPVTFNSFLTEIAIVS